MNARVWMFPPAVLALVFVLYAAGALNGARYDWDIDHMMYFGGRLLEGELVWTREFDDKLPFVQLLFALPAAAGSVKAWQALSILSVLAAALAVWLALRRVLVADWGIARQAALPIAAGAAALYLFLAAALPGSLSHINPMAASMLTLATLLLLCGRRRNGSSLLAVPGTMLAPAFFASVAVSLRPYLLAPALFAGVWAAVRVAPAERKGSMLLNSVVWTATLGATGLALNAAPFLVAGATGSFIDGLSLLGQQLNPQSLLANVSVQVRALYFGNDLAALVVLAWMAFGAWILLRLVRRDGALSRDRAIRVDVLFAVVLSPLALELMILNKHFWPHYQQLFIPYAVVSLAFMLALAIGRPPQRVTAGVTGLLLLGAFLVLVRMDVSRSALGVLRPAALAHEWESERNALAGFLQQRGAVNAGFLNPSHMYLHWTFVQPRHGFPHAANTLQVSDGWWARVRKPPRLDLPLTRREYCEQLERRGPRFIVDRPGYWVLACFSENPGSRYRQAALLNVRPGAQLAIYERLH